MSSALKMGLLIAAPSSGSGKTVLTLALLRALKDKGQLRPMGNDTAKVCFFGTAARRNTSINRRYDGPL